MPSKSDIIQQAERLKPVEYTEGENRCRVDQDGADFILQMWGNGKWWYEHDITAIEATALRCHVWMQALADELNKVTVEYEERQWWAIVRQNGQGTKCAFHADTLDLALAAAIVAVYGGGK